MKRKIFSLCLLAFVLVACPNENPMPVPPPIDGSGDCITAQEHLESLCKQDALKNEYCCQVVKPTLKGVKFKEFCEDMLSKGIDIKPGCLSGIVSCDQINACTNSI